jgi:lycopene cyclase domain-containing protein
VVAYFDILATFILPPLLALLVLVPWDMWRWLIRGEGVVHWEAYLIVLMHVAAALAYTTPWDNYLVATGVWWYDPNLVTGIAIGWVPIEEYTFFVVQTLLSGLWTVGLMGLVKSPPKFIPGVTARHRAAVVVTATWLVSTLLLLSGWRPGTYLTLILSWALIPVLIQVAFGADILQANWRLLVAAIAAPTLYLWAIDALAIQSGTWSIDPLQTTGVKLGPIPLEEMLFFLMTNSIIAFGITLMLAEASRQRAQAMLDWLKGALAKSLGTRMARSQ